jgi:PAS domain S-box-containing protein
MDQRSGSIVRVQCTHYAVPAVAAVAAAMIRAAVHFPPLDLSAPDQHHGRLYLKSPVTTSGAPVSETQPSSASARRTTRATSLAVATVMVVILAVGGMALLAIRRSTAPLYDALPDAVAALGRASHAHALAQSLRYYDEVQAQAIRNYAFTGDPKARDLYLTSEPDLQRHIQEAMTVRGRKDNDLFERLAAADDALNAIEARAIARVEAGHAEDARALLASPEYERDRSTYRNELERFAGARDQEFQGSLAESRQTLEDAVAAGRRATTSSTVWMAVVTLMALFGTGWMVVLFFRARAAEENENRRVQDARREVERRYATLFENSADALMLLDADGFIDCNLATLKLFRCDDKQKLLALRPWEISAPNQPSGLETRTARNRHIAEAAANGSSRFEWVHRRLDGEEFPSDVLLTAFHMDDRLVFQSTIRDLTVKKRALEQLSASRAMMSAITMAARDAIVMMDDQGTIAFWNPAAVSLFGYTAAEAIGNNLHDFLTPKRYRAEQNGALEVWRETGAGNAVGKTVDVFGIRKGGDEVPIELSLSSVRMDGRLMAVGIMRDITSRKRAEDEWRTAREAADAANRAKSEFLANMSHEIRTPMNGVMGMTDLLLDTELTPEQADYARVIKTSSEWLLTVINDILDFSKIEARMLELDPVEFDLRETIDNALPTLALRASAKGLELACCVPPDIPNHLVGDPGRLRQVIVNLVGNAIKFTDRGEVVLAVTSASPEGGQAELHFTVTDTGIGIPSDVQQTIFSAFAQADASTTRKYGGTGLGLSISTGLIRMMGGRIWVESEVGKGSTFHFTVRLGLQEIPTAGPVPAAPEALQDLRVLVVDDNATNRRILDEMLRHWTMKPSTADGARAAIDLMDRAAQAGTPFPLLVLDAHMPGMDGFDLVQQIKQRPGRDAAAIIMLTSAGQRGDAARCRELGIAAYLVKPVNQSALLDTILAVLGGAERHGASRPEAVQARPETARHLRILVAEDNPVNRTIATTMLARRGHTVAVAQNGEEAVAAFDHHETGPFDLILMDVQMPVLDGFEATGRIRQMERASGGHVPIVALTARAMAGDRELCLQAGMDDYVSKPLRANELMAAIERVAPSPQAPAPELDGARLDRRRTDAAFDPDTAMASVDGDAALLAEIVRIFREESPRTMAEIDRAIRDSEAASLDRAAHRLKGSLGAFGARTATALARQLETMGRSGDLHGTGNVAVALGAELGRLAHALDAFVHGASS